MNILAREELRSLMDVQKGPCASLYISFPPSGEPSRQARIKLKNAIRELETLLEKSDTDRKEIVSFLEPLQRLLTDVPFWKSLNTALAMFLSKDDLRYFWLPVEVKDLVTFSERFHIKPLIQFFSGEEQYYLLALSQKKVRFFRGSRYSLDQLEIEDLPSGLKEGLKYEEREKTLQRVHGTPGGKAGKGGLSPAHGAGYELTKDDILKYFKMVDKAIRNAVDDTKIPLLVAAVESEISLFNRITAYPSVVGKGIPGNSDNLPSHELHCRSMEIMGPFFKEKEEKAIREYNEKVGSGRTAEDIKQLISMAPEGRIQTFFVARDCRQWGHYDPSRDRMEIHNEKLKGDQDLLDLAAYHTILAGGTVYVVDPERVPGGGLSSAIFRY